MLFDDEVARLRFQLPKIYPITDVRLSGLSHVDQTARLIDGGATLIQLREKIAPARAFYEDAKAAVELAHSRGARVLINDRVDIALMTTSDGVHLGQDDLPVADARRMLGPAAIIGVSTHTIEQVQIAAAMPEIDYLAFGPIFPTPTKADPDPVVGLDQLRAARLISDSLPIAAIGGISLKTLTEALHMGADSVAIISELYRLGPDIAATFKRLTDIAERASVKTA